METDSTFTNGTDQPENDSIYIAEDITKPFVVVLKPRKEED